MFIRARLIAECTNVLSENVTKMYLGKIKTEKNIKVTLNLENTDCQTVQKFIFQCPTSTRLQRHISVQNT